MNAYCDDGDPLSPDFFYFLANLLTRRGGSLFFVESKPACKEQAPDVSKHYMST